MLSFDEPSHTYRWNGKLVPGVTSILSPLSEYDKVPASILQSASERGRAVHLACQYDDEGDLDMETLEPRLIGYVKAWRQFTADHNPVWEKIEQAGYHPVHGYAGTSDRIGVLARAKSVIDIKTTYAPMPSVGPQLAAYAELEAPGHGGIYRRGAVYLKPDGTYLFKTYTDPKDWSVFLSLLTVRNWCAQQSLQSPVFA
jgi:hypothetical protein